MDEPGTWEAWTLPAEEGGRRLDAVLVARVEHLSRSRLQALVKAGEVRVDGVVVKKPGATLEAGARLELRRPPARSVPRGAEARRSLSILYEDEALAVFDKPAGLLTHRTERGGEYSLAELARGLYGDLPSPQGTDRPGIVHRLDRETSGVIVLGRTEPDLKELMRQFREREVRKTYRALVHGEPRFDSDWIDVPLGRDRRNPERIAAVELEQGGRAAETYYEVLERFGGFAHLTASPRTGRTHQIRVHLTSIGCPVVGDRVYRLQRGRAAQPPAGAPKPRRQLLHAARLELRHPRSGEPLSFEAPTPPELADWLAALRAAAAGEEG